MRRASPQTQPLALPFAVVAALCLCAAGAGSVHAPQLARTATLEANAFASLVTRFTEAARQTRPRSIIAVRPKTASASNLTSSNSRPQGVEQTHARTLREAILNIPPPVTL